MPGYRILHAVLLALACFVSLAAFAQDSTTRFIDIPAGDLVGALDALAKQSGAEFIYRADQLEGLHTEGARGNLSAEEALARMLRGSGLVARRDASGAILITRGEPPAPKPSSASKRDESAAAPKDEVPAELEKISVTGSRLLQASVEGPQEMKVYTARTIAQSGQKTVMDFLNTLPVASTVVTEAGADTVGGAGAVRLRGLPIGSTLVLLDGRAVEGAGSGIYHGNPFDINNIPIAVVERIEVVPEAASAVYGSDAIGGVVNVILRKDFDGSEISVTSAAPSDRAYRDTTVSSAWGRTFDHGSVSLVGSFQTRGALLGSEREITADQDYRRYGGRDQRSTSCQPGNVYSIDGSNLPGLSAPFAGIPYSAGGQLAPADFLASSGVPNRCSTGSFGNTLIPSTHRVGLMANGNYAIGDMRAFFKAMYTQIEQAPYLAPRGVTRVRVPANNPFNPFGVPVLVSYRFASEGRYGDSVGTERFSRLLAGLEGSWGSRWDWELAVWQSGNRERSTDENILDVAALLDALESTESAQSINLFSSGSPASPEMMEKILYDAPGASSSKLKTINGFVRGRLFDLPAGPIGVVLGGEYDHVTQASYFPGQGQDVPDRFSRTVRSLFGEARIPLLAPGSDFAGERLAVTFAGRYDEYSDFGARFTPQGGLEFRPTETLLLRASYADAFKAPDLSSVYAPSLSLEGVETGPDPLRGGEAYPTDFRYGGNLRLKPQTGRSRSFGFVWSSKAIENLTVGLTNFRVAQSDRITLPKMDDMIANPDSFPGRVIRAAPTAEDVARGYAGPITLIDASYANYGALEVEGFDLDLAYRFDTPIGTFSPALSLTEIYKYDAAVVPAQPLQNRLGYASSDAFATRWKGTASLGYALGPWTAHAAARYVSGYRDSDEMRALGDHWLFDTSLRCEFGAALVGEGSFLSNAYAQASVVNAFNRKPQFAEYAGYGYDVRMADIRGRFISLTIGTRW